VGVQIEEVRKSSASLRKFSYTDGTSAMIADIWTVIWKEWRELLFQRGSWRAIMLSCYRQ